MLPTFLGVVLAHIPWDIWYQPDDTAAYGPIVVRDYFNQTFAALCISRDGMIILIPRSSDLLPMDFFSGGPLKTMCTRLLSTIK